MTSIFRVVHVTPLEFKMAANMAEVRLNNALCWKPAVKSEIPTANRTASTTPDSLVTLPTLPDVDRLPEFKMADCKPEVDCISGME